LAHQGMDGAGVRNEADLGKRLHSGEDLANGVEPQAAAIIHMCIHESLHRLVPRAGTRGLPIVSLCSGTSESSQTHFQRPIFSSSSWKLARVIRVTSSMAVYL